MSDATILKEFLVSLGFQLDQTGLNKFTGAITKTTGVAGTAGKAIIGIGLAAQTMVVAFSSSLEKLYYQSKRTNSTVENLQGLEFGSKKIGLAAGQAREMLEGMAANLRMNPGLLGMLQNFGINPEGRDGVELMIELVQKLASMPHYVGAQFAQMFGIDEKSFFMLKQGLPELLAGQKQVSDLNKQYGVDAEKAAEASREMMNSYRDIEQRLTTIGNKWAVELMPHFREFNRLVVQVLDKLATVKVSESLDRFIKFSDRIGAKFTGGGDKLANGDVVGGVGEMYSGLNDINPFFKAWRFARDAWANRTKEQRTSSGKIGGLQGNQSSATGPASFLFDRLERQYGLPDGLLDKMWLRESQRGKSMLSPKGAKGHFQFMDDTARQYGVANPNDLGQSATGAARYMSDLMQQYGGDIQSALAAYNYGPGNFAKAGGLGGRLPKETRDYVANISGRPISVDNKTTIIVQGAGNPSETANRIADKQSGVNADLTRNLQGAIR